MTVKQRAHAVCLLPYRYPSPNVPLSAIRRFARQIADRFQPQKIVLFGSYAYGTPHAESDVDLLVVMPASNEISKSVRVTLAFDPPFALDLIVRTPQHLERGLREGDWFLREVIEKGKVLYEVVHGDAGVSCDCRQLLSETSATAGRRRIWLK
jgi:predicted nucleotidyltransferase